MKKIYLSAMFFGLVSFQVFASKRNLGSGVVFSSPNSALFRNPTALVDSDRVSLQGMWRFEVENPSASVVLKEGALGFGVGYRQEGGDSGVNIYEAGAATSLSIMDLGVVVRSVEEEGLDGDVAVRFNVDRFKLGFVGRQVDSGFDRVDGGLGIELNAQVTAEFNVKKPEPFDGEIWLYDAGLVFNADKISMSVGYDFVSGAGNSDGDLHAGVSFEFSPNVYLEGYYRPFAQEWGVDDWAAALRATF